MATTSLIVVHHEAPDELAAALASVAAGTALPHRTVIVDNSTSSSGRAGAAEVCDRFAPSLAVELVVSETNVGFGAGVNRAAALDRGQGQAGDGSVDGEILLVMNQDATVDPDTVGQLVAHLEAESDVAAASPLILNQAGRVWFGGGSIDPWLGRPRLTGFAQLPPADPRVEASPFLPGCVLAIRRSAFEEVGGFDEGYFLYYEDVDLCWRLAERGWRCSLVGTARALHQRGRHGDPDRNLSPVMLRHTLAGRRRFVRRHFSGLRRLVATAVSPALALRFAYLVAKADSADRRAQWGAIGRGLLSPPR